LFFARALWYYLAHAHMSRTTAAIIVLALYALHQDVWFWREARPLVFGVLPIGLFYHVAYAVVTSIVLAALVRYCWPAHLEHDSGSS
jgi:hypothetical protein